MSRGGGSSYEAPKPVRMPVMNDPAIEAARKKAITLASKRGGRQSTLLSNMMTGGVNGSQGNLGS